MTVDFSIDLSFVYTIVALLGGIAIIYLIFVLRNILKITKQVSGLIEQNNQNITQIIEDASKVSQNAVSVSDSVKDISDVVTDTTADFLVTKDRMQSNLGVMSDILQIIKDIFFRKE